MNKKELYFLNKQDVALIEFFVINCPSDYMRNNKKDFVSHKGITFEDLEYSNNDYKSFKKAIEFDLNNNLFNYSSQKEYEKDKLERAKLIESQEFNHEYAWFVLDSKKGFAKTLFHLIRNSFAHGLFENDNGIYNLINDKAQMRLKYDTLCKLRSRFLNKNFVTEDEKVIENINSTE
jgi:hypothetical protein